MPTVAQYEVPQFSSCFSMFGESLFVHHSNITLNLKFTFLLFAVFCVIIKLSLRTLNDNSSSCSMPSEGNERASGDETKR